jgi:hypothetical protein
MMRWPTSSVCRWRLNNLYTIKDKAGKAIPFRLNDARKSCCRNEWTTEHHPEGPADGLHDVHPAFHAGRLHVQLQHRGRRRGSHPGGRRGVLQGQDQVRLRQSGRRSGGCPIDAGQRQVAAFSNGSSIRVGTSLRSGTFQYLHVSEFGKLCARFPTRRSEVVTGALNTIEAGQFAFIESTQRATRAPSTRCARRRRSCRAPGQEAHPARLQVPLPSVVARSGLRS